MNSARIFHGLLAAIAATGLATTLVPAVEDLVVNGWIVASVLAGVGGVAKFVADETRWHREMNAIINAPEDPETGAAIKESTAGVATLYLVAE